MTSHRPPHPRADPPLARSCFVDPAWFERERALFDASWHWVGHASELSAPGAYRLVILFGRRVILVRGHDFELRAFYDGCLHRRTSLITAPEGALESLLFECPNHGLRCTLEGRPLEVDRRRLGLAEGAHMVPLPIATAWSFVFVALGRAPEPLGDVAAPPWFASADLASLRLAHRKVSVARANWKACAHNFLESHHFDWVHPGLAARTPAADSTSFNYGGPFFMGTMELTAGHDTVSDDGSFGGRLPIAAPEDRRRVGDALYFPLWMSSLQPDYFLSYALRPRSHRATEIEFSIYIHAGSPEGAAANLIAFWTTTNAEDRAICEATQTGLEGNPHDLIGYAPSEDALVAFDRTVTDHPSLQGGRDEG